MAYDDAFFQLYEDYLHEPRVRANHDLVMEMWQTTVHESLRIVDVGCGANEFGRYAHYRKYVGVDVGPSRNKDLNHVQADYTKEDFMAKLPWKPTGFVSLFSVEACLSQADRYAFYQKLFDENINIVAGLAAGFYYKSKRHDEVVGEAGNIQSFQTIDDLGTNTLRGVKELRVVIETPSTFFGEDVVEVWKIFLRD